MAPSVSIVDAFTREPFGGNPAAVCRLGHAPPCDDAWHQSVASEMNLSETAFVRPRAAGDGFDLRWFTPALEVPLCGHATLASAHVLWESGATDDRLAFHTLSGVLHARRLGDGRIELDLPAQPLTEVEPPAEAMAALGVEPVRVLRTDDRAGGDHDFLVEVADEATVHACAPDFRRLLGADAKTGWIVTSRAEETTGADFVSRYFCPAWGIDEDPVTGAAHCALVPYWQGVLATDRVTGYQASARGGWVLGRHRDNRALLAGHAVTVLRGELSEAAGR